MRVNLTYLNFQEVEKYLNLPIEQLDKSKIQILKWHANNLKFIINGYKSRLFSIREEISELRKKLESNLGIEIPEKVIDNIKSLKGCKKEERIKEFINFLKTKYNEIISYEIEELRSVDEKIKRIENKLLYETNQKRRNLLLKRKKELERLKVFVNNPEGYRQLKLSAFETTIKENYSLIDKFVGKVMELDYVENTIRLFEKKYELILNKLSKIYRRSKIEI